MNERQLERNIGRIPRLIGHIARCKTKNQADRVAGFESELKRRTAEMKAAGHSDKVKQLIADARAELKRAA